MEKKITREANLKAIKATYEAGLPTIIQYVIGNADNSTWSEDGDINNDSYVDVLDIILLINSILSPQEASWDFETRWDGEDCYIFLNYTLSSR